MEAFQNILSQPYFLEKPVRFEDSTESSPLDITVKQSDFEQNPDRTYNAALHHKLSALNLFDRGNFIQHQISQCENPDLWLQGFIEMLRQTAPHDPFLEPVTRNAFFEIALKNLQTLEQEATLEGATGPKLQWHKSPGIFFMLMAALHREGYFSIENHGQDQGKVAEALYAAFEVRSQRKDKKPYQLSTFRQNFKQTGNFQSGTQFLELKNEIEKFIKRLEGLNLR